MEQPIVLVKNKDFSKSDLQNAMKVYSHIDLKINSNLITFIGKPTEVSYEYLTEAMLDKIFSKNQSKINVISLTSYFYLEDSYRIEDYIGKTLIKSELIELAKAYNIKYKTILIFTNQGPVLVNDDNIKLFELKVTVSSVYVFCLVGSNPKSAKDPDTKLYRASSRDRKYISKL